MASNHRTVRALVTVAAVGALNVGVATRADILIVSDRGWYQPDIDKRSSIHPGEINAIETANLEFLRRFIVPSAEKQ